MCFLGQEYNDAGNNAKTVLIKTDINGNLLWKKYIGFNFKDNGFISIDETNDGSFILCGMTNQFDTNGDPCILKLNSCGEYQGAVNYAVKEYNFATQIKYLSDNSFALLCYCLVDQIEETSTLLRIDSTGRILWQKTGELYAQSFIVTRDSSFLLTGSCYKAIPGGDPDLLCIRSVIMKINNRGNEVFYKPFGVYDGIFSFAHSSRELNNGNILTVGGRDFYNHSQSKNITVEYLINSDSTGNSTWHKWIGDTTIDFGNSSIIPFNDSLSLILSCVYLPWENKLSLRLEIMNNDGKIIKEKIYHDSIYSGFIIVKKTFDNNYIICTTKRVGLGKGAIMAMKIKPDLELAGFNPVIYHYDSLCQTGIDTSTITLANARIIPIDLDSLTSYSLQLNEIKDVSVYPNPATDHITIKFNSQNTECLSYHICDLLGKIIKSGELKSKIRNEINISNLKPGIYVILLNSKNQVKTIKLTKQ